MFWSTLILVYQKGAFSFDTHYRTLWWGVSKCAPRCEVTAGKDRQPFKPWPNRRGFCISAPTNIRHSPGTPISPTRLRLEAEPHKAKKPRGASCYGKSVLIVVGEPIRRVNNKTLPMAIAAAKSFFIVRSPDTQIGLTANSIGSIRVLDTQRILRWLKIPRVRA